MLDFVAVSGKLWPCHVSDESPLTGTLGPEAGLVGALVVLCLSCAAPAVQSGCSGAAVGTAGTGCPLVVRPRWLQLLLLWCQLWLLCWAKPVVVAAVIQDAALPAG